MIDRRSFIQVGIAGAILPIVPVTTIHSAEKVDQNPFPIVDVAPLSEIGPRTVLQFSYPDNSSPAMLIRLDGPGVGGVGPNKEIVAYSQLCTHKGCPVGYRPQRKMLICPCHWSTFDPARAGTMIIGQASQSLPQVLLRVEKDIVQAYGVNGLIYGRQTNII